MGWVARIVTFSLDDSMSRTDGLVMETENNLRCKVG